jgi:hypothetical protein
MPALTGQGLGQPRGGARQRGPVLRGARGTDGGLDTRSGVRVPRRKPVRGEGSWRGCESGGAQSALNGGTRPAAPLTRCVAATGRLWGCCAGQGARQRRRAAWPLPAAGPRCRSASAQQAPVPGASKGGGGGGKNTAKGMVSRGRSGGVSKHLNLGARWVLAAGGPHAPRQRLAKFKGALAPPLHPGGGRRAAAAHARGLPKSRGKRSID